jgi:antitoxin MazE9
MRVSLSLPEDDVAFLDEWVLNHGLASRSAAVRQAIRTTRLVELEDAYAEAFEAWDHSDDADLWGSITADGLAPR